MVKALTLKQPWASLVMAGVKRVETRSWRTLYTGPLIITASAAISKADHALCYTEPYRAGLMLAGHVPPPGGIEGQNVGHRESLPHGRALCIVDLIECVPTQAIRDSLGYKELKFGDYTGGRWAWVFSGRVWAIPGAPWCRGALSLWTPGIDLAVAADRAYRPRADS